MGCSDNHSTGIDYRTNEGPELSGLSFCADPEVMGRTAHYRT